MKVMYSVTYEFAVRPPLTHRGEIEAWAESTCTARAVKAAKQALRPVNWTSMVCVLLERLDEPAAVADEEVELSHHWRVCARE